MNLSEAIRLGCKMTKPTCNKYIELGGGEIKACALGAASVSLGHDYCRPRHMANALTEAYPFLAERSPVRCPDCEPNNYRYILPLRLMITHLNDDHRWTRERIADWLEDLGL